MCTGKTACSYLGGDPTKWSVRSPLVPKEWFESQLELFEESVSALLDGDRAGCLVRLADMRSSEIREWYIVHAMWSGRQRARILGKPRPAKPDKTTLDPRRSTKMFEAQVFVRDGFRCRYCDKRLVSRSFLRQFKRVLNTDDFRQGPRDRDTHGAFLILEPCVDHVVPWTLGGRTAPENLVTSCNPCNYGKAGYTIEQMGLEDPFLRKPHRDGWDGLSSLAERIGTISSEGPSD